MSNYETGKSTQITAYHGTKDTIDEFVISADTVGSFTCNNGGAVFFTTDLQVAMEYSTECQMREWEDQGDNLTKPIEEYYQAKDKAYMNAHCYEVQINARNPLVLDIANINQDENFRRQGLENVLDSFTLNYLINILQDRKYQKYMECYEQDADYNTLDKFSYLFEEYDEESDDYIEKEYDYDCIIIEDCIDSVNEDTNYMPSTIIAVLDTDIISIKECIKA